MTKKIVSIILVLGLSVIFVWATFFNLGYIKYLLFAGLVLCLTSVYNYFYLSSIQQFNVWIWLRQIAFLGLWMLVFLLFPNLILKLAFIIGSIFLVYFLQNLFDNTGQQFEWNFLLVVLICLCLVLFGVSFYIVLPGLFDLGLVFLGVLLIFRAFAESMPKDANNKWLAASFMALIAVQIYWVLQFLPLHFSILAVILFNVLYLLWSIYYNFLYQTLTIKQIQLNFLIVIGLCLLAMLATPWTIRA